jgi:hypothetical protein
VVSHARSIASTGRIEARTALLDAIGWILRSVLAAGGVSTFDVVDEYLKEEESQ